MMLLIWYDFFPLLSICMLKIIVGVAISGRGGIGCWKDMKHLCHYIRGKTGSENHPLILVAVDILLKELNNVLYHNKKSLVAKWIPREKTKYNWLFCLIVQQWSMARVSKIHSNNSQPSGYSPDTNQLFFTPFRIFNAKSASLSSLKTFPEGGVLNEKMCKKRFRTIISQLNRDLDIIETKQCSREWSNINPKKINTLGFIMKKSLFRGEDEDKILDNEKKQCSQRLNQYLHSESFFNDNMRTCFKNNLCNYGIGHDIKTNCSKIRNIPIGYYVKQAFELISSKKIKNGSCWDKNDIDIDTINKLWSHNMANYNILSFILPIIFVDKFVLDESFFYSVGLACLLSEKSIISKRILFYINGSPHWISFDDCPDFFSIIVKIKDMLENVSLFPSGCSFIEEGISILLDSMFEIKMSKETMEKMVLVFINIEKIGHSIESGILHSQIIDVFKKRDIDILNIPHIVYWNCSLNQLIGLPCHASDLRVSLISGMSSSLIHSFYTLRMKTIRNMNPFDILCFQLHHKKYHYIRDIFDKMVVG